MLPEGAELLQLEQTARMTFSELLQALDDMISLAGELRDPLASFLNLLK